MDKQTDLPPGQASGRPLRVWWRPTSLGAPDTRQEPRGGLGGIAEEIRRTLLASASRKEVHYNTAEPVILRYAQIAFPKEMLEKIEARMSRIPGLTDDEVECILGHLPQLAGQDCDFPKKPRPANRGRLG